MQQKIAELCKTQQDGTPLNAAADPLAPPQEAETAEPQNPDEEDVTLGSPETGAEESLAAEPASDDVAYAPDGEEAEQEAVEPGPRVRLDLDCLGEDLVAVLRRRPRFWCQVATCTAMRGAAADCLRPRSTKCRLRASWRGAAPACPSWASLP